MNIFSSPNRDLVENSTDSPVNLPSRTSDLEVHWRSPNIRLLVSKKEAAHPDPCDTASARASDIDGVELFPPEPDLPTEVRSGTDAVVGRSSMNAILDRLEAAAFQAVRNADKKENSLLACFDPLVAHANDPPEVVVNEAIHPPCGLSVPENPCSDPSTEVVSPSEADAKQNPVGHLISPLNYDQGAPTVTEITPATPLSTGFTPIPASRRRLNHSGPASPYVFSPWMHRSFLDQAFGGGGDESPEWTDATRVSSNHSPNPQSPASPTTNTFPVPEPLPLSPYQSDTTATDLSQSYASAVALSDPGDLDMLASMLERVNVCHGEDDSQAEYATKPDTEELDFVQRTPDAPISLTTAPGTYDVRRKPNSFIHNPSADFSPLLVEPQQPTPASRSSVPESRRRTINLNNACPLAPVVDAAASTASPLSPPETKSPARSPTSPTVEMESSSTGRLSIGSISGIVTMAARTLYDRIGGSSVTKSPADIAPRVASPRNTSLSSRPPETPCSPRSLLTSAHPVDPSVSVQSVEDDVWESVDSIREPHSTMVVDTSIRATSFQLSEENKENLDHSQTDISQPCYPSHTSQLCESMTDSVASVSSNVIMDGHSSRSFRNSRDGLHETQITSRLTASGDGPELVKSPTKVSDSSTDHEAFLAQKQTLQDEIDHLRAVAVGLKSVIDAQERTLQDANDAERMRYADASVRILQVAAECDEAIEQAATMYKAYEDMHRRVQRANETIEAKNEKQKAAIQCIDRYANRIQVVKEKYTKLNAHYLDRLTHSLASLEHQQDEWCRKLDKLQVELRTYELRNTTLTDEIRLKEQQCAELTEMSNKFFR